MAENDHEMRSQGSDAVAVARARDAAVECVRAVASFDKAVNAMECYDWKQRRAHVPLDYRPYVAQLYRSLRLGWDRIGRVWPQLIEAYPRHYHHKNVLPKYGTCPPVFAWLLACERFWAGITDSAHAESALNAWIKWDDMYVPDLRDYPAGDQWFWGLLYEVFDIGWPPKSRRVVKGVYSVRISNKENYDVLIAEIATVRPADNAIDDSVDQPLPPPATLLRPKPLPTEKAALRRLHEQLGKEVARFESFWRPFSLALQSARRKSPPPKAFVGKLLDDLQMQIYWDFESVSSEFGIPPLYAASANASFIAACRDLGHSVSGGEPSRPDAGLPGLIDAVIEAGSHLSGIAKTGLSTFPAEIGIDEEVGFGGADRQKESLLQPKEAEVVATSIGEDDEVLEPEVGETPWYHRSPPPEGAGFLSMPLTGTKEEIARWSNFPRSLESAGRDGLIWLRRWNYRTFNLYCKSQHDYDQALKRQATEQPEQPKSDEPSS
jgi:hypothetical protein